MKKLLIALITITVLVTVMAIVSSAALVTIPEPSLAPANDPAAIAAKNSAKDSLTCFKAIRVPMYKGIENDNAEGQKFIEAYNRMQDLVNGSGKDKLYVASFYAGDTGVSAVLQGYHNAARAYYHIENAFTSEGSWYADVFLPSGVIDKENEYTVKTWNAFKSKLDAILAEITVESEEEMLTDLYAGAPFNSPAGSIFKWVDVAAYKVKTSYSDIEALIAAFNGLRTLAQGDLPDETTGTDTGAGETTNPSTAVTGIIAVVSTMTLAAGAAFAAKKKEA